MKRKTPGRVYHQRECAYCKGGIAEQRPVFLVGLHNGDLVGPLHAGCARKVSDEARRKVLDPTFHPETAERFGRLPREETLPW